ncbi:EscU/YscU/HrcU family type III secretion system export apparatus switch protein [Halalkalibacter kiskunsagensis]|uniref:EscU/YscU/HrcU family type III secretion system export apparatus switch protein n=1 Tax=Halalkalibacter kiskunsagensis TaxID=1548599 RepID=A0ABV6KFF3_9BACI
MLHSYIQNHSEKKIQSTKQYKSFSLTTGQLFHGRITNIFPSHIQEDASLVDVLAELELNQAIPQELYEVVAEVFAFIYRIDRNV